MFSKVDYRFIPSQVTAVEAVCRLIKPQPHEIDPDDMESRLPELIFETNYYGETGLIGTIQISHGAFFGLVSKLVNDRYRLELELMISIAKYTADQCFMEEGNVVRKVIRSDIQMHDVSIPEGFEVHIPECSDSFLAAVR